MIDYVTLLLVNMTAGLAVLVSFLWWGIERKDCRDWAPAFGISGLVGTVAGLAMTFTWPIPAPYSSAYGEMSVLLGVLFLGAAWALQCGWQLYPLGIYAFFPGVAAVAIGVRIFTSSLTAMPLLTAVSFIVTGSGGVFAGVALWKQNVRIVRILGGLVMFVAVLLWVPTAYMSYWMHMKVTPATNRQIQPSQGATDLNAKGTPQGERKPSAAQP
jgi:putative membrane protein